MKQKLAVFVVNVTVKLLKTLKKTYSIKWQRFLVQAHSNVEKKLRNFYQNLKILNALHVACFNINFNICFVSFL